MLVNVSNVVEVFLQVMHSIVERICPLNKKNINDQSLLKLFDHDSSPNSSKSLPMLSGFSMYGFTFLRLVSS